MSVPVGLRCTAYRPRIVLDFAVLKTINRPHKSHVCWEHINLCAGERKTMTRRKGSGTSGQIPHNLRT
eukprot:484773-Rhodomonas_salina.3